MQYPQRIDKHITESSSFKIFSTSIPDNWIIREVTERDYGIDCYVELVNQNNQVTGELVSIQLKGKQGINWTKKDYFTFSGIKISTSNYWNNFPTPVFICLVDIYTKEAFFCPVKTYIRQNILEYEKQKSLSYKILKRNKLDLGQIENFINSYEVEKELNLFSKEIITFVSNYTPYDEFIREHYHRDQFLGIENDRILFAEHFYNNVEFLCRKFNIKWELKSFEQYKIISMRKFGKDYSLYENEMSEIVKALEKKLAPIVLSIKKLIWSEERDFWLYKNNELFNLVANANDDGTFW